MITSREWPGYLDRKEKKGPETLITAAFEKLPTLFLGVPMQNRVVKYQINKAGLGNSLVVQWLRLGTVTARAQVQFLVGELRFHKPCSMTLPSQKKKKGKEKKKKAGLVLCWCAISSHWVNIEGKWGATESHILRICQEKWVAKKEKKRKLSIMLDYVSILKCSNRRIYYNIIN